MRNIENIHQDPEILGMKSNEVSFTLEKGQWIGQKAEHIIADFWAEQYKNDRALKQKIVNHIVEFTNVKETKYQIKDPNVVPENATLWYYNEAVRILIRDYILEQEIKKIFELKEEVNWEGEKEIEQEEIRSENVESGKAE